MKRISLPFDFELERSKNGRRLLIGVDEVGRGCLAGPVVAAAVAFDWSNPNQIHDLAKRFLIHDSKTLNRKQRIDAAAAIRAIATHVGIGEINSVEIDEINILQATLKAMKIAIECSIATPFPAKAPDELSEVRRVRVGVRCESSEACILIDGNQRIPQLDFDQETIIDGDAKIFSIAAASIVAKEYRDAMMERFDKEFPGYDFSSHKGYGTAVHRSAIRSLGLTPIHRKTFWHG